MSSTQNRSSTARRSRFGLGLPGGAGIDRLAAPAGEVGHGLESREHVALDLDQRYRSHGITDRSASKTESSLSFQP